jgi:hypothetical protein
LTERTELAIILLVRSQRATRNKEDGVTKNPVIVQEILDGKHDESLALIQRAATWRLKNVWRKKMPVRLTGTKNPELEGKTGVILKVNQKSITVGIGTAKTDEWGTEFDGGTYNVPPSMLAKVEASA